MQKNQSDIHSMNGKPYLNLILMAVLSFIAMYILMYFMVHSIGNVFNNANEFYVAGLMAAPMVLIELFLMRSMYPDRKRNMIFYFCQCCHRSMIPHHAGAILMCEQAKIQAPEIQDLCRSIISSQQHKIDQMKAKLAELDK